MELRVGMKAKFAFGYMEIVAISSRSAIVKYYSPGHVIHNKEGILDLEFLEELYDHNFIKSAWQIKFHYK